MKKILYPVLVFAVFSVLFWCLPSTLASSEGLQKLSLATRDVFFKVRRLSNDPPSLIQKIVIVAIDDESCQKLEARWPWSRNLFARLIEKLQERGAAEIGLGFSFMGLESENTDSTQALASAIRSHGNVVVGATIDQKNRLVPPYSLIAKAVSRFGYLEKISDADALIRKSYLVRPYTTVARASSDLTRFESSFPLQLVGQNPQFDGDLGLLTLGEPHRGFFIESSGSYTINYTAGESDFEKIPAWKVIQGGSLTKDLAGKTVLVGLTSSLLPDIHPTPLGTMPGIAIHANEVLSLSAGRMLNIVSDSATFFLAWILGLCILMLFAFRRFWLGIISFGAVFIGAILAAEMMLTKDVLLEPFILLCGPFLSLVVGVSASSFELLREKQGLETKAVHDKLTGLYNYGYLCDRLSDEWKRCRREKMPLSIAMTDLDRFKQINDTLGHETGNEMIVRAAQVIKDSARRYDTVARYGGDEFVILLWHANESEAGAYRERLRRLYQEMTQKCEQALLKDSSISIGVATFDPVSRPDFPPDSQALIQEADKDLFLDKARRKSA